MSDQGDSRVVDNKSDDSDQKSDNEGLATSKIGSSANLEPEAVDFECPVCLQTASFPVQLPCRHIFCFLCVKGFANRSKRCAMCRQEIPADFFNEPKLLREMEIKEKALTIYDEGYQWFYEGRNGWWQYDDRTSNELERKYKNGDKFFELLIAGFLYIIDLDAMRQFRRNDQTRRRKIKREKREASEGIKGIAGLRFTENQPVRPSGDGGETSNSSSNQRNSASGGAQSTASFNPPLVLPSNTDGHPTVGDDSHLPPSAPNNTPQTPMTPADSQPGSLSGSQEDLSDRFNHLHINTHNNTADVTYFPLEHYDEDHLPRHYRDRMYPTQIEVQYDSIESAGSDMMLPPRPHSPDNDVLGAATAHPACPGDYDRHPIIISDDDDDDDDNEPLTVNDHNNDSERQSVNDDNEEFEQQTVNDDDLFAHNDGNYDDDLDIVVPSDNVEAEVDIVEPLGSVSETEQDVSGDDNIDNTLIDHINNDVYLRQTVNPDNGSVETYL